jgi:hypothetical protein
MDLAEALRQRSQVVVAPEIVGQGFRNPSGVVAESGPEELPKPPHFNALRQRIHGHDASGVKGRIPFARNGLEVLHADLEPPPAELGRAMDDNLGSRQEAFLQRSEDIKTERRTTEPERPNASRPVGNDRRTQGQKSIQRGDVESNDLALNAASRSRTEVPDGRSASAVVMFPGEMEEEVADRGQVQLFQEGGPPGTDAFEVLEGIT